MIAFMMKPYRLPKFVRCKGLGIWRIITTDFQEVDFPPDWELKRLMEGHFPGGEANILIRWKGPSNTCVIRIANSKPAARQQFLVALQASLEPKLARAA